jgi:hypothetical protein
LVLDGVFDAIDLDYDAWPMIMNLRTMPTGSASRSLETRH